MSDDVVDNMEDDNLSDPTFTTKELLDGTEKTISEKESIDNDQDVENDDIESSGDDEDDDDDDDNEDDSDDDNVDSEGSEDEAEDEDADNQDDEEADNSDVSDDDCDRCPICLSRFIGQEIGNPESCEHSFCLECIREWSRNVNTCPVDRQVFHLIFVRQEIGGQILQRVKCDDRKLQVDDEVVEDDLTYCQICHQSDREDRMLLCDGCDQGFHMDCLTPVLLSVPSDEWFCPTCTQENQQNMADVVEIDVTEIDDLMLDREPASFTRANTQRRRIARTTIAERVRARIQQRRRRPVILDSESGSDSEDANFNPTNHLVTSSIATATNTAAANGIKSPVKRKRTTKRKTKRRKTSTKKKSKTGKSPVKRRRKTRRKKGRRSYKKVARVKSLTPKSRIARSLGLGKPPPGRIIPTVKEPKKREFLDSRNSDNIVQPLSIFGSDLDLPVVNDSEPIPGPSAASSHSPVKRSKYSTSALNFRCAIAKPVLPGRSKRPALAAVAAESTQKSSSLDFLGDIMAGQELLHLKSKDVQISKDGYLERLQREKSAVVMNGVLSKSSDQKTDDRSDKTVSEESESRKQNASEDIVTQMSVMDKTINDSAWNPKNDTLLLSTSGATLYSDDESDGDKRRRTMARLAVLLPHTSNKYKQRTMTSGDGDKENGQSNDNGSGGTGEKTDNVSKKSEHRSSGDRQGSSSRRTTSSRDDGDDRDSDDDRRRRRDKRKRSKDRVEDDKKDEDDDDEDEDRVVDNIQDVRIVEVRDKGDRSKGGKSDKSKDGKSDRSKDGKNDKSKDGKSDRSKDGKSDRSKDGKSDRSKDGDKDRNSKVPISELPRIPKCQQESPTPVDDEDDDDDDDVQIVAYQPGRLVMPPLLPKGQNKWEKNLKRLNSAEEKASENKKTKDAKKGRNYRTKTVEQEEMEWVERSVTGKSDDRSRHRHRRSRSKDKSPSAQRSREKSRSRERSRKSDERSHSKDRRNRRSSRSRERSSRRRSGREQSHSPEPRASERKKRTRHRSRSAERRAPPRKRDKFGRDIPENRRPSPVVDRARSAAAHHRQISPDSNTRHRAASPPSRSVARNLTPDNDRRQQSPDSAYNPPPPDSSLSPVPDSSLDAHVPKPPPPPQFVPEPTTEFTPVEAHPISVVQPNIPDSSGIFCHHAPPPDPGRVPIPPNINPASGLVDMDITYDPAEPTESQSPPVRFIPREPVLVPVPPAQSPPTHMVFNPNGPPPPQFHRMPHPHEMEVPPPPLMPGMLPPPPRPRMGLLPPNMPGNLRQQIVINPMYLNRQMGFPGMNRLPPGTHLQLQVGPGGVLPNRFMVPMNPGMLPPNSANNMLENIELPPGRLSGQPLPPTFLPPPPPEEDGQMPSHPPHFPMMSQPPPPLTSMQPPPGFHHRPMHIFPPPDHQMHPPPAISIQNLVQSAPPHLMSRPPPPQMHQPMDAQPIFSVPTSMPTPSTPPVKSPQQRLEAPMTVVSSPIRFSLTPMNNPALIVSPLNRPPSSPTLRQAPPNLASSPTRPVLSPSVRPVSSPSVRPASSPTISRNAPSKPPEIVASNATKPNTDKHVANIDISKLLNSQAALAALSKIAPGSEKKDEFKVPLPPKKSAIGADIFSKITPHGKSSNKNLSTANSNNNKDTPGKSVSFSSKDPELEVIEMDAASPLDDLEFSFSPPPLDEVKVKDTSASSKSSKRKYDKHGGNNSEDTKSSSLSSERKKIEKENKSSKEDSIILAYKKPGTKSKDLSWLNPDQKDDKPSTKGKNEKVLQKLNRQERVIEEVKLAIKPHYSSRKITKDEYKEILRKTVPKICHSKCGDINPVKIKSFVDSYVSQLRQLEKWEQKKKSVTSSSSAAQSTSALSTTHKHKASKKHTIKL